MQSLPRTFKFYWISALMISLLFCVTHAMDNSKLSLKAVSQALDALSLQKQKFIADESKPLGNDLLKTLSQDLVLQIAQHLLPTELCKWAKTCKIAWQISPLNPEKSTPNSFWYNKLFPVLHGPKRPKPQAAKLLAKAEMLLACANINPTDKSRLILALNSRNYILRHEKSSRIKKLTLDCVARKNYQELGRLLTTLHAQDAIHLSTILNLIKTEDLLTHVDQNSFEQGYLFASCDVYHTPRKSNASLHSTLTPIIPPDQLSVYKQSCLKNPSDEFIKGVELFTALECLSSLDDRLAVELNHKNDPKFYIDTFNQKRLVTDILGINAQNYTPKHTYIKIVQDIYELFCSPERVTMRTETTNEGRVSSLYWQKQEEIMNSLKDSDQNLSWRIKRLLLQDACQSINPKILELLLKSGANVNGIEILGLGHPGLSYLLWHYPLKEDKPWLRSIRLLVDYGADLNQVIYKSSTILTRAIALRHETLVRFFINNGADVNAFYLAEANWENRQKDTYGTSLDAYAALAKQGDSTKNEIYAMLVGHGAYNFKDMPAELKEQKKKELFDRHAFYLEI